MISEKCPEEGPCCVNYFSACRTDSVVCKCDSRCRVGEYFKCQRYRRERDSQVQGRVVEEGT